MSLAYDDACPRCRQPTATSERVACGGCLAYHHVACWARGQGCGGCGVQETHADREARRLAGRAREQRVLVAVLAALLLAQLVPFRPFGWVTIGDLLDVDLLSLVLLAAAAVVTTRLVRV